MTGGYSSEHGEVCVFAQLTHRSHSSLHPPDGLFKIQIQREFIQLLVSSNSENPIPAGRKRATIESRHQLPALCRWSAGQALDRSAAILDRAAGPGPPAVTELQPSSGISDGLDDPFRALSEPPCGVKRLNPRRAPRDKTMWPPGAMKYGRRTTKQNTKSCGNRAALVNRNRRRTSRMWRLP